MPEVVTGDGVRIVYDDLGPTNGVPVLLCHGLAAAGEQLRADGDFFAGLGYRVLLPDLRGHGRSGKPAALTRDTLSIPRLAADLVAVLDHAAPGRVHWVGNSLGGILGLELLRGHAARFRTLATFGTAYKLDVPVWVAGAIRPAYWLLGRRLAGWLTARSTTRNAAARRLIARLIRAADPEVVGIIAQNVSRYDLIANATGVDLPILLLRCGRDLSVNRALGPTLAAIRDRPNITVVDLPEGGHCANLDATGTWRAALLEFWRMH